MSVSRALARLTHLHSIGEADRTTAARPRRRRLRVGPWPSRRRPCRRSRAPAWGRRQPGPWLPQAETGERPHFLDHLDLLVAGAGENDGELVLLLLNRRGRRRPPPAAATAIGAAAVTSKRSSKASRNSFSSSTVIFSKSSSRSAVDIFVPCVLPFFGSKAAVFLSRSCPNIEAALRVNEVNRPAACAIGALHRPGDLGQQHLSRFDVGQPADLFGPEHHLPSSPPLRTRRSVSLAKSFKALAVATASLSANVRAVGPTNCSLTPQGPARRRPASPGSS